MNNQLNLNLTGRYAWPNPESSVARPLGRERVIFEVGGVKLATPRIVRDPASWAPGSIIKSATGRAYVVRPDGSLRRAASKPSWRLVRAARRAITRGRLNEVGDITRPEIRALRKEGK